MTQGPPGWFLVMFLLCLVGAATGWAIYLRLQNDSLPQRQSGDDTKPPAVLLETTGGGRVGMMNYSGGLVQFVIDEEGVVFRLPFAIASLGWRDITRAVLVQPIIPLSKGVEFQVPRSQPLTIWAAADTCAKILDLCEQHEIVVIRSASLR